MFFDAQWNGKTFLLYLKPTEGVLMMPLSISLMLLHVAFERPKARFLLTVLVLSFRSNGDFSWNRNIYIGY